MKDLDALSARALAAAIAAKKISSHDATQEALTRLEAAHELTNAVHRPSRPMKPSPPQRQPTPPSPRVAELGALAGVPLAHKDMFDREGKIASWGAKIRADKPAREDATAIARFKASGALQIAALQLTEFAFGPTGHNYIIGHARNPWDPARITGGSSSGTGSAVAYGAIPAGLGSDTGGSLRLPAAACGVTSIKPTWGRVSRAGAMPLAACARHRRRDRPPRRGSRPHARHPRRARPRAIPPRSAAGARLRRAPRPAREGHEDRHRRDA